MSGRTILIHGLADARAALANARAAGEAVTLLSAPVAAAHGGAAWFAEVIAQAAREFPHARFEAILDCGDGAGYAMAALRAGIKTLRFTGSPEIASKLDDMARACGARVIRDESSTP